MKIGIYDPYLDDLGGGEKYMMTIAQCLSQNHQVSVFWDDKRDVETLLERFNIDLSKVRFTKNIFSPQINLTSRLLETKKYDAIIVLSDGSIPLVLSKKLFLHIQSPMPWIKLGLKDKLKLRRVNGIFCNSYFTKKYVDISFHANSMIIYPPISFFPKNIKKENIILHVGRFRVRNVALGDYKKQNVMIDAFKQMVKKGLINWEFVLSVSIKKEDSKHFKKLQEKAKGFPIRFLINYPNQKLWDIYSKAKIYWHASGFGEDLEKHPEYAEHFGIATVEAMGAGAIPVVINAGGQKEIVEDGKSGFLWDTPSELKAKTLKLIHEEKLLKRMSQAAKKRADYFSGDRFCEQISRLVHHS